jgi:hypothetical protein
MTNYVGNEDQISRLVAKRMLLEPLKKRLIYYSNKGDFQHPEGELGSYQPYSPMCLSKPQ